MKELASNPMREDAGLGVFAMLQRFCEVLVRRRLVRLHIRNELNAEFHGPPTF